METPNQNTVPRSAYDRTGGIVYFARMLGKIGLRAPGTLRADFPVKVCMFGSVFLLTAHCLGQAPVIVTQPQSEQISAGASLSLTVAATGAEPLFYLWHKNGRVVLGQTNDTFVFNNASPTDTGSYTVSVQNSSGNVSSEVARLQVNGLSTRINPIALTGWNQDVVLEDSAFPAYTADFDTFGSLWFEAGWNGHSDGLPSSLTFTSQFNPAVTFQFRPYTTNNVLRLDTSVSGMTGTLTLVTPAPYRSLAILASSGNGRGSGQVVLNFVDGTSISNLSFIALDWYDFSTNLALAGLGRRDSALPPPGYGTAGTGFGFFETDLDLVTLGLDRKFLKSLTFTKPANPSVTGIFSVSGEPSKVAEFTSVTQLPDGRAQLNLSIFPELVYRIDSSTNLTDWTPMVSIASPSGMLQFTDKAFTNQTQKFYRAVAP